MKEVIYNIQGLCFGFEKDDILTDVTFSIYKHDFICIKGTNGSGKSTLLKLLIGSLKPRKGSILLHDKQIKDDIVYAKASYVSQIGYQVGSNFPATGEEILSLGNYPIRKSINKDEYKKRYQEIVDTLSLKELLVQNFSTLSGGQKQRILLGKALLSSPDVLLLDEPSSSIDKENVDNLIKQLHELHKKGLTIIVVSHDERLIAQANRVLELENCCLKEVL